ncbi:MAG: hypothetical protein EP335_12245 [Alphaproteobacteria bacterium]|nr:MAG: hypothetical protein EP335_12245 [Alphaproteobacteria bacterium]
MTARQRLFVRLWAGLALLTFLSFATQAYLVQTHEIAPQLEAINNGMGGDKVPGPAHGSNCPLCQSIAAAGAYLTPPTASLPIPAASLYHADLPPRVLAAHLAAPGHIWRGRAPPKA